MTEEIAESGGCKCGAVRYAFEGAPAQSLVCHCPDCRRSVGAHAVAWLVVDIGKFQITRGVPIEYASSPGVRRTFCGTCGTSLAWLSDQHPDRIDITTGSLDAPERFPPSKAVYRRHRVPWASLI